MPQEPFSMYNEGVNEDFRHIAETYFSNYIIDWCNQNHVDDRSREYIIKVLSDYSLFFFDSIMHDLIDSEPPEHEMKN
ncbi:hypothetical protein K1X84_01315 [bacterium]|nr:hypothetical protein [bacterium]